MKGASCLIRTRSLSEIAVIAEVLVYGTMEHPDALRRACTTLRDLVRLLHHDTRAGGFQPIGITPILCSGIPYENV